MVGGGDQVAESEAAGDADVDDAGDSAVGVDDELGAGLVEVDDVGLEEDLAAGVEVAVLVAAAAVEGASVAFGGSVVLSDSLVGVDEQVGCDDGGVCAAGDAGDAVVVGQGF